MRNPESILRRSVMAAILVILSVLTSGPAGRVEMALLDARFAVSQAFSETVFPAELAVLLVTPETEKRLGAIYDTAWRQAYPLAVERISDSGALGIVWDATFAASVPAYDTVLAEAFSTFPVFAAESPTDRTTPVIRESLAGVGSKSLAVYAGVPRSTVAGEPPLGAVVAQALFGGESREKPRLWLDFSFDPTAVPTYDLADVLLSDGSRLADEYRTPLSVFTGRAVFIGLDLPDQDRYPVPGSGGVRVPGVFSQVVSLWTHLSPRVIVRAAGVIAAFVCLVFGFALTAFGSSKNRRVRSLGIFFTVVMALFIPPVAFLAFRLWLPYGGILVLTGTAGIMLAAERRLVLAWNYRTSLGFDPRLLEAHATEIEGFTRGIERETAVLCADVRNYTQFVTDRPADEVQRVMGEYMAAMESVIREHGGYINKFVGDEIVAIFGFPLDERNNAGRATEAARHMLAKTNELRAVWSEAGLSALDGIGIGVDTGTLRFTNLGGRERVQFDVIGSAVNGASRFQTLTKTYDTPLIVSEVVAGAQNAYPVADSPRSSGDTSLVTLGEAFIRGQGKRLIFGLAGGGG